MFQTQLSFVSYYVNGRPTAWGIPVPCEVDIYRAPSEYTGTVIDRDTVALLDISNTIPKDMYETDIKGKFDYIPRDTFMGFHYGNTVSGRLSFCEMKCQVVMTRALPTGVTQGILKGGIKLGSIIFYRLQSTADNELRAYTAQGEVLPVATRSFGFIGMFAAPGMGWLCRHVPIEKNFPHHGAMVFRNHGKTLFEILKYIDMDVEEVGYNQPRNIRYRAENPLA